MSSYDITGYEVNVILEVVARTLENEQQELAKEYPPTTSSDYFVGVHDGFLACAEIVRNCKGAINSD